MIFIVIVFALISFGVSMRLKNKFAQYSQMRLLANLSGKDVAEKMLRDHGVYDVKVTSVEGQLTDHYNPMTKTVNLSTDVYNGQNVSAAAVAAHECGHAVQHATAYSMLKLRSTLVPIQNVSASVMNVVMLGMMFGGYFLFNAFPMDIVLLIIVACNLVMTSFALITLPVEFDASKRGLAWLTRTGMVASHEHEKAKDALWWAAMTYVVAALGAIAQLLYWVMMLMGGRRDD
jgi:Zn-dependent membrane protease YugP